MNILKVVKRTYPKFDAVSGYIHSDTIILTETYSLRAAIGVMTSAAGDDSFGEFRKYIEYHICVTSAAMYSIEDESGKVVHKKLV